MAKGMEEWKGLASATNYQVSWWDHNMGEEMVSNEAGEVKKTQQLFLLWETGENSGILSRKMMYKLEKTIL